MTHVRAAGAVPPDGLTVGGAASAVGVTVRTLHHWDELGLASPSRRTTGGHRLYDAADVTRLHRIRLYRELGVPLSDVAALLDAPAEHAEESLLRQRDQVRDRIRHLERSAEALDRLIEARRSGVLLTPEDQAKIFGADWQPAWTAEARERWGDTAQWAQYAERAADRGPEDYRRIVADLEVLHADLGAAVREGVPPDSARARALAERHRASIGAYFDCTHSMHVCLGRTYVTDPGYRSFYDGIAPGLAGWLRDAVDANARAHGVDPETATWT
ncbi:MerR family transcriptional regulator [Promicromonospora sp. NPDC052451]|uniref:MerR family transcriptional regulator n=1 Tax=Promicromonospora sp. NPDC052451 TaxID=3364407 RepID=UPI0037C5EF53